MANAEAHYKNERGDELHFSLDIDLKSQRILSFTTSGSLVSKYSQELKELKKLLAAEMTINDALKIKRADLYADLLSDPKLVASLSLWLLHKAIEDYLGTGARLNEQKDMLCFCFGVTRSDLKKEVLARSDYGLPEIIAETFATSACGSCLNIIEKTLIDLRASHGLIKGMSHSQSRTDKAGHWVKILGLYPADLIIKLDDLQTIWMKREAILDQFKIELVNIIGHHLFYTVMGLVPDVAEEVESERAEHILKAFSAYLKSETGVLFFLNLALPFSL
jgi:bacterioferritin-associated ferredoxin